MRVEIVAIPAMTSVVYGWAVVVSGVKGAPVVLCILSFPLTGGATVRDDITNRSASSGFTVEPTRASTDRKGLG